MCIFSIEITSDGSGKVETDFLSTEATDAQRLARLNKRPVSSFLGDELLGTIFVEDSWTSTYLRDIANFSMDLDGMRDDKQVAISQVLEEIALKSYLLGLAQGANKPNMDV